MSVPASITTAAVMVASLILSNAQDLSTIPQFDDLSFLSSKMTLFDSTNFRKCVAGKYILLFGDSTMTEFADDLVLLLSGIGNQPKEVDDYAYKSTHVKSKNTSPSTFNLNWNVSVEYHNFHRNMTISVPSIDTFIRYRYSGDVDLHQNRGGLHMFSDSRFKDELEWHLSHRQRFSGLTGQHPDVIILNSCHHDFKHGLPHFQRGLQWIFKYLTVKLPTTQLIWKSTFLSLHYLDPLYLPFLFPFETAAANLAKIHNVTYVNTTYAYDTLLKGHLAGKETSYTTDFLHHGSIAKYHNLSMKLSISSFTTQVVLDSFCGGKTI